MKKLICTILAIIMIVSTMGTVVFAADASDIATGDYIVKVNNDEGVVSVEITADEENPDSYEITLAEGEEWTEDSSVEMIFPAVEGAEDGDAAYVEHVHGDNSYFYVGTVKDGKISITNKTGFSTFTVNAGGFEEAVAAAEEGDTITILGDVDLAGASVTLPDGITLNGNGHSINAVITTYGNLEIEGDTSVLKLLAYGGTITIGEGASFKMTSTERMVIGHGTTFNITGDIEDAKAADVEGLTPSLIAPGASFTGNGVTFNVTNAYVKFTAYCSSKNKSAYGTHNYKITNSIWEQTGSFVFSAPTEGMDPTFNLTAKDSVFNSTSHFVIAVTKSNVVIDNSNVNVETSQQLENRGTLTIQNGSVVNAKVAASSNAANPGTVIVDNATYNATGAFTKPIGVTENTGRLILRNNAVANMETITDSAAVIVDASSCLTAKKITNTPVEITFDKLAQKKVLDLSEDASREGNITLPTTFPDGVELEYGEDGDVTVWPYVAQVGDTKYLDIAEAFKAVKETSVIEILADVTIDTDWQCNFGRGFSSGTFNNNEVTINGNNHVIKFTGKMTDKNTEAVISTGAPITVNDLTFDLSECPDYLRVISARTSAVIDNCTFIGNPENTSTTYAVIVGESGGDMLANTTLTVTDSDFVDFNYGISDNRNGVDIKAFTINGNEFNNASVLVGASDKIEFTNNIVADAGVTITSYAEVNELSVVATGNTLDATATNYIKAAEIETDGGFKLPVADINGKKYISLNEAVSAVEDGDIIVLTDDVSDETVTINGDVKITGTAPVATFALTSGSDITLTNVIFDVKSGASLSLDTVAVRGLSYINADMPEAISVTNCDIDVTTKSAGSGCPPAFINFSGSNDGTVELNFIDNILLVTSGNATTHGIAGWNSIESATITGNIFGSAEAPLSAAAVKLMNFTEGADVEVYENTFYVNSKDSTCGPNALQLYQNNSRGNNYTATISDNVFYVDSATAAIGINENAMNNPEAYPGNGRVAIDEDNIVNGRAIAVTDILVFGNSINDIGTQDYVGLGIEYDENGNIIAGTFSEYSVALNDFLADNYVAVKNSVSGWLEVSNEGAFANSITVKFVKADVDDAGEDNLEGADEYNIVLEATSDINEFASAELTFVNASKLLNEEVMPYVITAADNMTLSTVQGKPDYYGFSMEGDEEYEISGKTVTLGKVTFTGYGTVDFGVVSGIVNATTVMNNLVKTYVVGGAISGDVTKGNLEIGDKIDGEDAVIAVPVRDLEINIKFPNAIVDQAIAYQDMKVVISGGDLAEDITVDLGSDAVVTSLPIDGKANAKYAASMVDGSYVINVTGALTLNNAYTVTVSGAGYRTARYTVTMTEDKVLKFWNNVMDKPQAVESGRDTSAVNVTFLAGDIVKDNNINIYDLSAVVSYFGTEGLSAANHPEYAKYDLNRDGLIDSRDVAYILVSWNN